MSDENTVTVVGLYQKVEVPEPKPVVPKPEVVIDSQFGNTQTEPTAQPTAEPVDAVVE